MNNLIHPGGPAGPCATCKYVGTEGGGEDGPSYDTCERFPNRSYLKSFPFKKPQPCHVLGFWESKFADGIKGETMAELDLTTSRSSAAYHEWVDKTYPTIKESEASWPKD